MPATTQQARAFFDQLNEAYNAVHKRKEDLFWATYMATSDDHAGFAAAEGEYKAFISDPLKLSETRQHLQQLQALPAAEHDAALLHGLTGWLALFEANIIDNDEGRALMAQIIEAEAALFAKKRDLQPTHINEQGETEVATLSMLATNQATNPREERRRSSFEGFQSIEHWVLANGFLDLVKLRNRFARALGFENYFELKLRKNERMTPAQLKGILDDFVARTNEAHTRTLADLKAQHGEAALQPWNLRFFSSGDVVRRMDEYMPFGPALRRWVESFRRLGIQYRGATMQLDLLARKGKYQNGFCHGPIPSYVNEKGEWVPGQINFTAEAKPDQVGSGLRAINTLFHEGGHAAHFANVAQNSPCFSQEFAPTSMAYAETQSMFCDSLLGDADWLKRYAKNAAGEAIPDQLIHDRIASSQPMRAFDERSIAVVPYFEAALYEMSDEALTAESVLALARATELRVLGMASPRPMLAIPHLLNQESAASYQGYLLAHMAVYQTRAYFLREYGYLTDNVAIGPQLAQHYWVPGNSIDHDATLRSLTGEGFSARYLAEACNQSVADCWREAQGKLAAAATRVYPSEVPAALDAQIRVVHGDEVLADSSEGEAAMCRRFEAWVKANFPQPVAA
ncbi:M3 family metallopeptidase [Paucibacter sp. Y2R2-4]|uniref:M3 family metallopeptidase n=1 Tax=Paucibacter sp. Y2R2-4 TaxID=2893553 RepID=UPI0021E39A54|nr:M3 family metallopeptidase [Paucibacter sp. Y2R2-4]MCV2351896.1 M3 family metallopeptidase [Paucibacter sp. Y2R2-4]